MYKLLDGKEVSKYVKDNVKNEVEKIKVDGINPKLAVILVGEDSASKVYVRNKSIACNEVGIEYEEYLLPDTATQEELISLINSLNENKEINGILLQSPIPKHLDINEAFRTIDISKDVDGFHPYNSGLLSIGEDALAPCTPLGIIKMLEYYNINIEGKNAVVIGRSNIVGKPMFNMLLNKNATVTVCHSKTKNLKEIVNKADIVVAAIGKAKFVTEDMIKENAIVIDVGMNRDENGKLCGDIDFDNVSKKVSYITPVPGGVGPMTVAMLMSNIVKTCKKN